MKAIINIFLMLLLPLLALAQNPKKAFKKLESGDYTEAKVVFNQLLKNNADDVAANYGMAVIFSQDKQTNFDLFLARKHIKKAIDNFDKIPENELSKLEKYISKDVVENAKNQIEKDLVEFVKSQSNIELSKKYIQECQDSEYYENILRFLHKQEYKKALEFNSEIALKDFLKSYPEANQAGQAQEHLFVLAWKKANEKDDIESYTKFRREYPTAPQYDIALDKIREIKYKNALKVGTDDAYINFLEEYPNTKQAEKLIADWENRFYNQVKSINTIDVYNKYLSKFPESQRADEIREIRNKLEYERVKKLNTEKAYSEFVKKYPNARQANDAMENLNKYSYSKAELDYFKQRNSITNLGISAYKVYKSFDGDSTKNLFENVVYDRYGNVFQKNKILNNNHKLSYIFKYGDNGDLISQQAEFINDNLIFDINKIYDSNKLCIKEIHKCYNDCNNDSILIIKNFYDKKRNLIKKEIFNADESQMLRIEKFEYDANNQFVKKTISADSIEIETPKTVYKYDASGNLVEKTKYDNTDKIKNVISYTYQNNKLKQSRHNDKFGKYTKKYVYDHRGILKKIEVVFDNKNEENYELNYQYTFKAQ